MALKLRHTRYHTIMYIRGGAVRPSALGFNVLNNLYTRQQYEQALGGHWDHLCCTLPRRAEKSGYGICVTA